MDPRDGLGGVAGANARKPMWRPALAAAAAHVAASAWGRRGPPSSCGRCSPSEPTIARVSATISTVSERAAVLWRAAAPLLAAPDRPQLRRLRIACGHHRLHRPLALHVFFPVTLGGALRARSDSGACVTHMGSRTSMWELLVLSEVASSAAIARMRVPKQWSTRRISLPKGRPRRCDIELPMFARRSLPGQPASMSSHPRSVAGPPRPDHTF